MKRIVTLIVVIIFVGIGISYYVNIDKNYHTLKDYYDFPVPNSAKLGNENSSENTNTKSYFWDKSSGTDVPLSYRLMIKKSGWKQVEFEGTVITYKKDGKFIKLAFSRDYIDIVKNENKK
ncbi:hypothetical protein ACQKMD_12600 [Viridibacillus sp. NPDC096237]|uniref:hypothetical protein n=1 Tax=Viridibacillus sp. NPDC096237 TaxID=3390721 RepID=UPI003D05D5C5